MELKELLRRYMEERNIGTAKLIKSSGLPMATLARILNGQVTNPQIETLEKIAKGLGMTVLEFYGGAATICTPEGIKPGQDYVKIRTLQTTGNPELSDPETDEEDSLVLYHRKFFEKLQANHDFVVRMRVIDDAMTPIMWPDDFILVDTNNRDRIINNQIYVIRVGDDYLIRRLKKKLDGSVTLLSANPSYDDETLTPEAQKSIHFQIIGKVIHHTSGITVR